MSNPALLTPDAQLDLRGTPCPINFVRTKLRLEQMSQGSLLEVWLDPGEPIEQVPDSLVMEGYQLEQVEDRNGFFAILVRRPLD
ncbi:sulfurtransferase TusA family protein [Argonema galeatum]|uniref:sulfurtransferase TusA family protein n=1 Tax=Argonema galeatum TaxID=2942762 RepID=UPI0020117E65|nr:sulfurtransferase TusA family protein [Argonema galeatum]MCL1465736.1 sulfurtransferase TusA family protein [Argonema galeatum A003/A1]